MHVIQASYDRDLLRLALSGNGLLLLGSMGRLRHWRGEKILEAMACMTDLPKVIYGLRRVTGFYKLSA